MALLLPQHHLSPVVLPPPQILSLLSHQHRGQFRCYSSKKKETSLTNRIHDYIEGGPKLRKWYGAPELLPKYGGPEAEEGYNCDGNEEHDTVLVTDGYSEMGQLVILLLILRRVHIKALVKDKRAAMDAFGIYVEALVGDVNDKDILTKTLRGVYAIICASNNGFFSDVARIKAIQHIVFLYQVAVGSLQK